MELINATRMIAGYAMGMEPSGRELLVIVVKGTFQIPPQPGAQLSLHAKQEPLVMSDVFYGEPGVSAPKYEIDFAPRKGKCDVLLNGRAYAPAGRTVERIDVGMQIGSWSKSFSVVGDRYWFLSGGPNATEPEPFAVMPVTYDRAFGGTDLRHEDPAQHAAYMPNPVGRGFHKQLDEQSLDGSPLPNTEETGVPVSRPDGSFRPMSFGPVGRHWEPRYRHAGTYDQNWKDNIFPFLPPDFDERYYQAAPEDQQLPIPPGEQQVSLRNLTPEGYLEFRLPHFEAPIHVFPKRGDREDLTAQVDTLVIEPDLGRVLMTWRVARPLQKSMHEIAQVLVGRKGAEWWQQRSETKFSIPVVVERMARPKSPAGSDV